MSAGPLIIDIQGEVLTDEERDLIRAEAVGGVILFGRNTVSLERTRELCDEIHALRPELFVCVDQEGGRVQRLTDGVARLPFAGELGDRYEKDPDDAIREARELGNRMARDIRSAGIDFSFAPVLDIDYGHNSVIGRRAFGRNAATVDALARAWIEGVHEAGSITCGKHYPGHGYVSEDSHVDLPHDPRPLSEIRDSCLRPFASLADILDSVMPSHVVYDQVDVVPAGFSSRWMAILRDELGFSGPVISDDLTMAGAAVAGGISERVRAARDAGCDFVIVCNNPEMVRTAVHDFTGGEEQHERVSAERAEVLKKAIHR